MKKLIGVGVLVWLVVGLVLIGYGSEDKDTVGKAGVTTEMQQKIDNLVKQAKEGRNIVGNELKEVGKAAGPALEELVKTGDANVKLRAMRALIAIDYHTVPVLLTLLEDKSLPFRVDIVENLGKTNDEKARDKVIYNIHKARFSKDKELFKKLKDEIWEFRTLFNKTHYRLFAFWDKTGKTETVVISTHGLIKKTDKTPKNELEVGIRLKEEYFLEKLERKRK